MGAYRVVDVQVLGEGVASGVSNTGGAIVDCEGSGRHDGGWRVDATLLVKVMKVSRGLRHFVFSKRVIGSDLVKGGRDPLDYM